MQIPSLLYNIDLVVGNGHHKSGLSKRNCCGEEGMVEVQEEQVTIKRKHLPVTRLKGVSFPEFLIMAFAS